MFLASIYFFFLLFANNRYGRALSYLGNKKRSGNERNLVYYASIAITVICFLNFDFYNQDWLEKHALFEAAREKCVEAGIMTWQTSEGKKGKRLVEHVVLFHFFISKRTPEFKHSTLLP